MAAKLREASARGNTQEVLRLLDDGTKILPDEAGRNPLHLAASAGHADVVAALLLAGCDVNLNDSSGCTALQRASAEGHLEVVKQLIKHGADVNRQDRVHGNTALHEASWKGYSRTVAILVKSRANLHLKNCGGFTALHLCCQNGHNQSCRELLLGGCNPDIQNNYGDTPLHTSARYGHAGVTRILISAQCHVSDQNKNGDTALHIAAAMGRRKLTRILLEAGCNKNLKNKQHETAKDIATRKDLNEILVILTNTSSSKSKSKTEKNVNEKRGKQESGTSSKESSSRQKNKKKHKNAHKVDFQMPLGKNWSPYGCHYYPDPKTFPQPKLDSLPHEPLKKGEQYYLDLAGNIRKGPVGVGYTCYCAPFFRHIEARLERDKEELKKHIDQANERLDQKVSSLERRTQGQLSELTRCVMAERVLCDKRHQHLTEWLSRGGLGRSSERVRNLDPVPLPFCRARSLELLLDDERGGDKDVTLRHLPQCEEFTKLINYSRNVPERNAEYRLSSPDEKITHNVSNIHNRSVDALIDKESLMWRGEHHRRSAEFSKFVKNGKSTNRIGNLGSKHRHNRSFDTLLENNESSWNEHFKSEIALGNERWLESNNENFLNAAQHNTIFNEISNKEDQSWQRSSGIVRSHSGNQMNEFPSTSQNDMENKHRTVPNKDHISDLNKDWREKPVRRTVQEMVARIQQAQVEKEAQNWKTNQQDCKGETDQYKWSQQGAQSGDGSRKSHVRLSQQVSHDDDDGNASTDSSDGEDEVRPHLFEESRLGASSHKVPNYENVDSCGWQAEDSRLVSGLPYRSRSAVYSPTQEADHHNDSGYSTKICGSSQGPSPSLSGHLEYGSGLPNHNIYNPNQLPQTHDQPQAQPMPIARQRHNKEDLNVTNVVAASLV